MAAAENGRPLVEIGVVRLPRTLEIRIVLICWLYLDNTKDVAPWFEWIVSLKQRILSF